MTKTKKNIIKKKGFPEGIWTKCKNCDQILLYRDFEQNFMVCPKCGYYARLNSHERLAFTVDKGTFREFNMDLKSIDFLHFQDYAKKIEKNVLNDVIITGEAKINGYDIIIAIMDFSFMGGSMGSVVGEKIVRAIERALKKKYPVIIISASGGARIHEGVVALMQMVKTSAALAKLSNSKIGYISILTDPTTGGVAASFAMLGDINIAEPKTLIGFAGPRVIEQTIKQQLPDGFQLSEFLEKHGMLDLVVERKNMKTVITKFLRFFYDV
ncbi:MAG: acetyl-CoA carboxylase, carboxyltransferase subunit beta [Endomicrobium sp.]|jgi:acetyl-CoA carboxylase carboxyl transferase subunit beta|nr:acetyl-CoA carboxylase, carboxyltransferase subunit beta [Endomicrobium sp.]